MASGKRPEKAEADGAERRVHPRHPVAGVSGNFLFSTDGKILNLSLDGMAIETSEYLQVGRTYSLKLVHEDEELILDGQVVWCRMVGTAQSDDDGQRPLYNAGVHFAGLMSETSREVHRFLGANAVVSLESRLFGRFRLHEAETANLDYQASFRVEKISLNGMQVNSDTFVEAGVEIDLELRIRRHTVTTTGRVVHSRRLEPQPGVESASHLGVEFLQMDEATEAAITKIIRSAIQ